VALDRVHWQALFLTGSVEPVSCAVYLLICGHNNGVSNGTGKVIQEGNHSLIQANSVRLEGLRHALQPPQPGQSTPWTLLCSVQQCSVRCAFFLAEQKLHTNVLLFVVQTGCKCVHNTFPLNASSRVLVCPVIR